MALSRLIAHEPRVEEVDINPVIAGGDALHCVDVRVMLRAAPHGSTRR